MSRILKAQEAARYLGVHLETLRRLSRQGEIPAFKVGRGWRYSEEVLREFARNHRVVSGPGHILSVDDEESVLKLEKFLLESEGYRFTGMKDAEKALERVQGDKPDLILLDLKMPGISGPEFLRELRKSHPLLPVVIITGHPDSKLMMEAAEYAPIMLLAKPFKAELLKSTVRSVLGSSPNGAS